MSGLDNSQPITDAAVLSDDAEATPNKKAAATADTKPATPDDEDELGDATPGPR